MLFAEPSASPASSVRIPGSVVLDVAGADADGPAATRDEGVRLRPTEPLRHGMTLDVELAADEPTVTLQVSLRGADGSTIAALDTGPIDRDARQLHLQVGWDPVDGTLTAGRPGAEPSAVASVAAPAVAAVELRTGRTARIVSTSLRHGAPRVNGHTAFHDLLIGPAARVAARWRDVAGSTALVESADVPAWQAVEARARLERVAPLFLAAAADAPKVVVAFAARVVEGGRVAVDLTGGDGGGMSFHVEPAGDADGATMRVGWARIGAADEGERQGETVVIDGRVRSSGGPVRVTFEWDRLTGRVRAQVERSPAHEIGRAPRGGEPLGVALRLDAAGDAVGALLVGTVPADAIDARDHGAVGDGVADDGPAIRRALAAAHAAGPRRAVYLPPGVHRIVATGDLDMLTLGARGAGSMLVGAGHGSVLLAARPDRVAVRLAGRSPVLARLALVAGEVRARSGDPRRAAVNLVRGSDLAAVVDCELGPAEETGLIAHFAARPLVAGNRVSGTLADGIHLTHATTGARVAGNLVRRTRDDGIAIVSYRSLEGRPVATVRDVDVVDNDVGRNRHWGRGIAVAGGSDLRISRNRIVDTNGAGLLLAAESSYDTAGVRDVVVQDNLIERPRVGSVGHAGLLLWADPGAPWRRIERIDLRRNTITDAGWRGVAIGCGATDVRFEGNAIRGSASIPLFVTGTRGRIEIRGNSIETIGNEAVHVSAADTYCPEGSDGTLGIIANLIAWHPESADGACGPAAISIAAASERRWDSVDIDRNRFVPARASCPDEILAIRSAVELAGEPCASNRSDRPAAIAAPAGPNLAVRSCRLSMATDLGGPSASWSDRITGDVAASVQARQLHLADIRASDTRDNSSTAFPSMPAIPARRALAR